MFSSRFNTCAYVFFSLTRTPKCSKKAFRGIHCVSLLAMSTTAPKPSQALLPLPYATASAHAHAQHLSVLGVRDRVGFTINPNPNAVAT